MDQLPFQEVVSAGRDLLAEIEFFLSGLMRVWNLYQLGILVALFVAAELMRRITAPRLHAWMRSREGWPMWRMRYLVRRPQSAAGDLVRPADLARLSRDARDYLAVAVLPPRHRGEPRHCLARSWCSRRD